MCSVFPAWLKVWALISLAMSAIFLGGIMASASDTDDFAVKQTRQRERLWELLGQLPRDHKPGAPQLRKSVHIDGPEGAGYTLEYLELDLNGLERVPAILLIPDRRAAKAPGMLYHHWHGGDYGLGKKELIEGNMGLEGPYAPVLASKGIVTLAIDSWCFGERNHHANREIEMDTFKEMLWHGRVLWGMMLWDEHQALTYLASRAEVDPERLGAMGISMGATKAWWLAALDPRIKVCIDICCLTDFDELLRNHNLRVHGIYYYVPGLLNHFNTSEINELIVPRARLSLNGRHDVGTPPAGVEKVRNYLLPLYQKKDRTGSCRIELFDCGHREIPEMRQLISEWLDKKLVNAEP